MKLACKRCLYDGFECLKNYLYFFKLSDLILESHDPNMCTITAYG